MSTTAVPLRCSRCNKEVAPFQTLFVGAPLGGGQQRICPSCFFTEDANHPWKAMTQAELDVRGEVSVHRNMVDLRVDGAELNVLASAMAARFQAFIDGRAEPSLPQEREILRELVCRVLRKGKEYHRLTEQDNDARLVEARQAYEDALAHRNLVRQFQADYQAVSSPSVIAVDRDTADAIRKALRSAMDFVAWADQEHWSTGDDMNAEELHGSAAKFQVEAKTLITKLEEEMKRDD